MKLKRFIRLLFAHIPTSLPQGLTEFDAWASDILELYDLPDNRSTRFALAASILHASALRSSFPKRYFGLMMRKGASNEVASFVMQEIKAKQKAEIESETLKLST